MIDLQTILIAAGLIVLGCAVIVYAACRLAALFDARRRRWEAMRFEHEQLKQRARLRTVAGRNGHETERVQ